MFTPKGHESIVHAGISCRRLQSHVGDIMVLATGLAAQHGQYHLLSISNILDFLEPDLARAKLLEVAPSLKIGGAVLVRSIFTVYDDLKALFPSCYRVDPVFDAELASKEKSAVLSCLAVGWRLS